MSTPTTKLPSGYATVYWGGTPPALAEATTMIGAAIIKAFNYENTLDRIKIEGTNGFVAGYVDMIASSTGAGGTKFDTEKISISCLHGTHATKTWPVAGAVITIASATGDAAKYNGDWSIVKENEAFARKTEADKGFDLERYADVDLTP
jgi:hypothetical protein